MTPTWLGVDVGAARKGFDVAVIDDRRLIDLRAGLDRAAVLALVAAVRPRLVGVDSPCAAADEGETARASELRLAREVCGIRWTPALPVMAGNPYYAWVLAGLDLFAGLRAAGVPAVEVFPTASWTRWLGPRGGESRASWTRRGLATLGLAGLPDRTNQDARDAIAAAVTVREHTAGLTEAIGGEIVVPRCRPVHAKVRLEPQ